MTRSPSRMSMPEPKQQRPCSKLMSDLQRNGFERGSPQMHHPPRSADVKPSPRLVSRVVQSFLQICFFRFGRQLMLLWLSCWFVQICLFRSFVCSDWFVQTSVFRVLFRFIFVCSCFFRFVCSDSDSLFIIAMHCILSRIATAS